jgi:uncharacterized coiled-coil protein SlyX
MRRKEGGFEMTDVTEKMAALEARIAKLEVGVSEAHTKADIIHDVVMEWNGFLKKTDERLTALLKNVLKKYGVLKEFCEVTGEAVIEHDKLLCPERSRARAERLTFVMKGSDQIN